MGHPKITVNMTSNQWKMAIHRFQRRSPAARRKALYDSGGLLIEAMRGKIIGPGHSRGPRSSPYPGEGFTGRLGGDMFVEVKPDGTFMRCGPGGHATPYAEYLEFTLPDRGTSKVSKPFVLDSWTDQAQRVFRIIAGRMFRLFK